MVDLPSGDLLPSSTNGRGDRGTAGAHRPPGSDALTDEQTLADGEQTLSDGEQTLSDGEQTLSDADQTSAERDQTGADCDQVASDRDQAASDRDLGHGVDPEEHEITRDIRDRATRQREQTASLRLETAAERDDIASARDLAGLARDRAAAARDLAMCQRDVAQKDDARAGTGGEQVMRAAEQRKRAAEFRTQAAEQRVLAAQDRRAAMNDREQGARDRLQALADREALAHQLAIAETDPLTGTRTRAAGLTDLDHELDRARRTSASVVVAYVDVVGLKTLNDSEGHSAGDELLRRVIMLIRGHVRSYDLIIRLGGDEFLCAMSNMTLADARQRFSSIAGALASSPGAGSIRTGFAELTPDETATELIERADEELIARPRG